MLIIVSVLQGLWFALIIYDGFGRHWVLAAIHLVCMASNVYNIHISRRTAFMAIWIAAQRTLRNEIQGASRGISGIDGDGN